MLTVFRALVFRVFGIRSPSLFNQYEFDYLVKEWLGVNKLRSKIMSLEMDIATLKLKVK